MEPCLDPHITARYDAAHIGVRGINKGALQETFGLHRDFGTMLIGVVSRLSEQKGLDLLLDVVQGIVDHGMQLALLGSGDTELEAEFKAAAERHPGRIGVCLGYNETLAHRIQAGADIILVPSRFEPCGLTQLCGLRYGAIPLVARAGGLIDTVIDANEVAVAAGVATGIQFSPITAENLWIALEKAARLFRNPAAWRTMQKNGMMADYSWHQAARQYTKLYRELLAVPASPAAQKEEPRETARPAEAVPAGPAAGPRPIPPGRLRRNSPLRSRRPKSAAKARRLAKLPRQLRGMGTFARKVRCLPGRPAPRGTYRPARPLL